MVAGTWGQPITLHSQSGNRKNRKWGRIIKPEGPTPQWYISSSIAPPSKGSIMSPIAPSSGGLVCKSISQWTTSHLDHSPSYILPATRREEVHLLGWCTEILFHCVYYCHLFTFSIFWVMSLKLKLEAEREFYGCLNENCPLWARVFEHFLPSRWCCLGRSKGSLTGGSSSLKVACVSSLPHPAPSLFSLLRVVEDVTT